MIPLYGFVEGDVLGLLVLPGPGETIAALAERLQQAASPRVAPRPPEQVRVRFAGALLDPRITVERAGLAPLMRVDLVVVEPG